MITRIAPTPNGELHWGNFLNFALTWAYAKKNRGEIWLRFDDIDRDRCDPAYTDQIRTFLKFVGLNWNYEYSNQGNRIEDYRQMLLKLPHYVCECSRQNIQKRTGDFHYDGACRTKNLSFQKGKNAIRFLHPTDCTRDFVLWRREDLPAYHLTSVFDDQWMNISTVIRGIDLLESTKVQQEISRTISDDPLKKITFIHHRLLLNRNGEKLAKSRHDGELFSKMQSCSAKELWSELGQRIDTKLTCADDLLSVNLDQYNA